MKKIWFVAKLSGDNSEYTVRMAEFPRIQRPAPTPEVAPCG